MAATDEMVTLATALKPHHATLVPERRQERTTEGGLDAAGQRDALAPRIARLQEAGIKVSLFVAHHPKQIEAAARLGVEQVELHTGEYADAPRDERGEHATALAIGAGLAASLGLRVAAGHGLTTDNVGAIARIPEVMELNIGHAIVSDAVVVGMAAAVRAMRRAIARGRSAP
jgi:pyridoxine 5-phosphate synthase